MGLIGEQPADTTDEDTAEETQTVEDHAYSVENGEGVTEHQDDSDQFEREEIAGREARRAYIGRVTEKSKDLWSNLSPRQRVCIAAGSLAAGTAIVLGGMQLDQNSEEESPEVPQNNSSTAEEVSGTDESETFLGDGGFNNNNETRQNEPEEPQIESEITKEGNYKETITQPDGTEITKEWYSPYAYTETTTYPGEDSEPQETYQESSNEPLASIDHPVYEQLTGTGYEEFKTHMKDITPEIGGEPYDAQDVLTGYNQRLLYALKNMDPRAIELAISENNPDYEDKHGILKEDIERYGELSADEKNKWDTEREEYNVDVELDVVVGKENTERSDSAITTDYNITRAHAWSGNYIQSFNGENPTKKRIAFVKQSTPIGEMFLVEEDRKLDTE